MRRLLLLRHSKAERSEPGTKDLSRVLIDRGRKDAAKIGTYMAAAQGFTSSIFPLEIFGMTLPGYAALYSVVVNFVLAAALTPIFDLITRRNTASTAR